MDDLEHQVPALFKFENYTIIERDSHASFKFPDAVVGRSNDDQHFLSILHDGCFVSELIDIHCIKDPASAAARDPFHADWPFWDRAT